MHPRKTDPRVIKPRKLEPIATGKASLVVSVLSSQNIVDTNCRSNDIGVYPSQKLLETFLKLRFRSDIGYEELILCLSEICHLVPIHLRHGIFPFHDSAPWQVPLICKPISGRAVRSCLKSLSMDVLVGNVYEGTFFETVPRRFLRLLAASTDYQARRIVSSRNYVLASCGPRIHENSIIKN